MQEEKYPITLSESQDFSKSQEEKTNNFRKFNLVRIFFKKFGNNIGYLIGIGGIIVAIYPLLSESPKLSSSVQEIELKTDINNKILQQYYDKLNRIETEYGYITSSSIYNILELIENIKNEPTQFDLNSKILELIGSIDRGIEYFQNPEISKKLLEYFSENLEYFSENMEYFSENMEGEKNKVELEKKVEKTIKEIIEKLQNIKMELKSDFEDEKKKKLSVAITLENQSKLPNIIRETGLIRLYDSRNVKIDIPLKVKKVDQSTNVVDGYKVKTIYLESKTTGLLDDGVRQSLSRAFEYQYDYILIVEDLHDKTWYTQGRIFNINLQPELEKLKREADKILEKNK